MTIEKKLEDVREAWKKVHHAMKENFEEGLKHLSEAQNLTFAVIKDMPAEQRLALREDARPAYTTTMRQGIYYARMYLKEENHELAELILDDLKRTAECLYEDLPPEVDALCDETYALGMENELEATKQLLEVGNGRGALYALQKVKEYAAEAHDTVPDEVAWLSKEAFVLWTENMLATAQEAYNARNYTLTSGILDRINAYAGAEKIAVPDKAAMLKKKLEGKVQLSVFEENELATRVN